MAEKNKTLNELESAFVSFFEDRKGELFESCHPAVLKNRKEAYEYFKEQGLPTNKDEKWRNSNIVRELDKNYKLFYDATPYQKKISEIFECEIHGYQAHVVSLLNGRYYSPDVDALQKIENGVIIGSMLTAQRELPEMFSKYYGHYADSTDNGFTALNSAMFRDGVFIYVPDNVKVEKAIQLLKIVNREENLFVNSRNLIIVGKNSEVSFLHCDDSVNYNPTFINTLTEIYVGENARLDLYKMQNLNDGTSLLNTTYIHQEKNSRSKVNVITLNGGKIRNELHVNLDGEAAEADLNGIYLMDKSQHVDNQVYMRHSVPHCFSNQLFKGVLDDQATSVFRGYIYVARDAQKTNAFQRNNNILMTKDAQVDSMPFLEIYADDVKCSHGATVGQLDNDALFYLMQRGISKSDARLLLMYAFTSEVTSKIDIEPLRISIEDMIKKRLRGELSICDKCVLHCSVPDKPIEFEIDMSKV